MLYPCSLMPHSGQPAHMMGYCVSEAEEDELKGVVEALEVHMPTHMPI